MVGISEPELERGGENIERGCRLYLDLGSYRQGLLSHLCRALRWQLLTRSMGYNIRLANSFMGVMIGYLANIALPRMGEFTRCGVVSKYERVPFSKLFGTVVAERVIDLGILVALTLVVVFTQFKQIGIFLEDNREVEEKIVSFFHSSWFFVFAVGLVLALYIVWRLLRKTSFHERLRNFWQGMKEGLFNRKACEAQVVVCILFAFYLVDVLPDVLRLLFLF